MLYFTRRLIRSRNRSSIDGRHEHIDVDGEEPSANHRKSICELAFSARSYRGGPQLLMLNEQTSLQNITSQHVCE